MSDRIEVLRDAPIRGRYLSKVNITPLCLDYDAANLWPGTAATSNGLVSANPWIFIWEDEQWYGATWEWMRPGQTCKSTNSVAGHHIKRYPFDVASGWTPSSGVTYYFMVSGLARFSERTVEERTNVFELAWP